MKLKYGIDLIQKYDKNQIDDSQSFLSTVQSTY